MYSVVFADIGEGLHEGKVVEIYKKVGEQVSEGDSLFSVETDKVTSDIPSPATGVIKEILIKEGETIHVGQTVIVIDDGSESSQDSTPETVTEAPQEEPEVGASVVGSIKVSKELLDFSQLRSFSKSSRASREPKESRRARRLRRFEESQKEAGASQQERSEIFTYSGPITKEFEVIVIGGGPGGYLAAELTAKNKLSTLLIEKEYLGGVCLNVGCIPTKTLLRSAEIFDLVKNSENFGIKTKKAFLDWDLAQDNKKRVVEKLTSGVEGLLRRAKVEVIKGEAKFVGTFEVEVNQAVYRAKNIILATGSLDKKLNQEGFSEGFEEGIIFTSKEALASSASLPKNITIIGGGIVGCEMAQIYSSFGHNVKIFHGQSQLLPQLDPEITSLLAKKMQEKGIEIFYNLLPRKFDLRSKTITFSDPDNNIHEEKVETVLAAVGRYPINLQVEKVGVKVDAFGAVVVDDQCQTNIKKFFAIGDCNAKSMLAHVAYRQAVVAVNTIIGKQDSIKNDIIPDAIYTKPEIASIGLSEAKAKELQKEFVVAKFPFVAIGRSISNSQEEGFCKMIVDKTNGAILGAQIIGASASDLISEISVAVRSESTVFEIAQAIHPHPSYSEILWETARQAVSLLGY